MSPAVPTSGANRVRPKAGIALLGPAFVTAIAYVDPGNVAANLSAGSQYGYALVWVLVLASVMAVLVQYQSAKLGIVTGQSLSTLVTQRLSGKNRFLRWGYAGQAFVMAVATDLAEVVGGALGLTLLFGWPVWLGGILVGSATLVLLPLLRAKGERVFEYIVVGFAVLIAVAFFAGLAWAPPDPVATLRGLWPSVPDQAAWTLVAAMLGATVMPHAIYLHSSLTVARHRPTGELTTPIRRLLRLQWVDVLLALALAGSVNIAMLLYAAAALPGAAFDTIESAHAMLAATLGPLAAAALGAGLLASGLGSAIVGTHAGATIAQDTMPTPVNPTLTRAITILPAVALLVAGLSATAILVASQVVLSFGIAFAAAPLAWLTSRRDVMGEWVSPRPLALASWVSVVLVIALNVQLLVGFVV